MDSRSTPSGLRMWSGRPEDCIGQIADELHQEMDDPFTVSTLCVENPGMNRWLSRQLSLVLGASHGGDGIIAGLDMPTLDGFANDTVAVTAHVDPHDDPWSPSRLTGALMRLFSTCQSQSWFSPVARHLGDFGDPLKPGRWFTTASRLAAIFRGYWLHRPGMLRDWTIEHVGVSPRDAARWQQPLWQELRRLITAPDPVERLDLATKAWLDEPDPRANPVRVFGLSHLSSYVADFLTRFSAHQPVDVFLFGPSQVDPRHQLTTSLGATGTAIRRTLIEQAGATDFRKPWVSITDAPQCVTSVAQVQMAVLDESADVPPKADSAIQLHCSHGPQRQVEVLREVLTELFVDHPEYEPRDVAVLCPNLATYAPLLEAALCLPEGAGSRHPGHRLRATVMRRSGAHTESMLSQLVDIIDIVRSRTTMSQLLSLAAVPLVSRQFGWSAEQLTDIEPHLIDSGIQWGLDSTQRGLNGLEGVDQGTVEFGMDRLIVGIALEDDGVTVWNDITPASGADSTDIALIGRVCEMLWRLRTFASSLAHTRTTSEWAELLKEFCRRFLRAESSDSESIIQLATTLSGLELSGDSDTPWAIGDVTAYLRSMLLRPTRRSSFGNGSLVVSDMESLRSVPHKVVCVLGLDESTFPRTEALDGDDLLHADPQPLDPDSRSSDRQLLYDAFMAARERFVAIGQAADPTTDSPLPLPLPLTDLLNHLPTDESNQPIYVVQSHGLYPYSATELTNVAGSFDSAAIAIASAKADGSSSVLQQWELPPVEPHAMSLETLLSFFRHPARDFAKNRCGLPVWDDPQPSDQLPIELDGLQRWAIGDSLLRSVLGGASLDDAVATHKARGSVLDGRLGEDALRSITDQVKQCLHWADSLPADETVHHQASVSVNGWTLTGSVATIGNDIRLIRNSSLTPAVRLEAWLRLLLLQAHDPSRSWRAQVVTRHGVTTWSINDFNPSSHMDWLFKIYALGTQQPLPHPLKMGLTYAQQASTQGVEQARASCSRSWTDETRTDPWWPVFFPTFSDLWGSPIPAELSVPHDTSLFGTIARCVWTPILRAEVSDAHL